MERSGRVAVFLQARINSTRLPGKALKEIYQDITVIGCAMMQLKKVKADYHVLLTDDRSYNLLKNETEKQGFEIFKGPEHDVLARFTSAARHYGVKTVVRATGDNPFVFPDKADRIVSLHLENSADHSWFTGMPLGGGVEIAEAEALFSAEKNTNDNYDREHVTPYIYKHPEIFKMNHIISDDDSLYPDGRITLDTDNDYKYLKKAADELTLEKACDYRTLIEWIKVNKHPDRV